MRVEGGGGMAQLCRRSCTLEGRISKHHDIGCGGPLVWPFAARQRPMQFRELCTVIFVTFLKSADSHAADDTFLKSYFLDCCISLRAFCDNEDRRVSASDGCCQRMPEGRRHFADRIRTGVCPLPCLLRQPRSHAPLKLSRVVCRCPAN